MTAEALPQPAQRPHGREKLPARDRLERLLDIGSFIEFDLIRPDEAQPDEAGAHEARARTDGVVTGAGTVYGRSVFVYAQDFRILGGSLPGAHAAKIGKVIDLALAAGAPLIAVTDSGGAQVSEGVTELAGYGGIFRRHVRASGVIPQISVILGPCAGGAAYAPALTDFVFMVCGIPDMFIRGPDVPTFSFQDEDSCLADVRYLVSLLPASSHDLPPAALTDDAPDRPCPRLRAVVPASPRQPYDMRAVLTEITDHGEFLELQAGWGRTIVCALARFGGRTAGIVADQPLVRSGALDLDASQKAARFVQFCDAFSIPLVTLVDGPGFLPGAGQEHRGIIRHGARLLYAYCDATVPRVQVILRQPFGGAGLGLDSRSVGTDLSFAWPANEIAVMWAKNQAELMRSLSAAERGQVDDVIDPADTRAVISRALDLLSQSPAELAPRKHGNPPA